MDLEKELIRVALVGTQRSSLSESANTLLENLGLPKSLSEENKILTCISVLSKINRSQYQAQSFENLTEIKDHNHQEKVCNSTSIKHLYMIVDGAFENALAEFLFHLSKNEKCLPPEILPNLLNLSLTSQDLWQQLKKSIGSRGLWLIQQNENWHRLLHGPIPDNWEDASNDDRIRIIKKLRMDHPLKALELLRNTWPSESINQRMRFIKALEESLDEDLEPFLETLLDDRRKEVRKAAAQLLARVPNSSLSKRMFKRLEQLITLDKPKRKLIIRLPDKLEESMLRDGIDPRVQWLKGGVKASRLGQMIAMIQPKEWLTYFDKSAEEVLELFVSSEWSELLLQAIVESTYLHQDEDWTRALLSFRISSKDRQRWQNLNISRLMDNISDEVFNIVSIKGMKETEGLLEENSPITQLLKTSASLWQDELTKLVISNLQNWLASESSRYWNGWHYRTILKKAAYTCNPFLHDELTSNWPEESRIWSSWEKEIDEFLSILFFRKKMILELKK